jgi:hypothetical protein
MIMWVKCGHHSFRSRFSFHIASKHAWVEMQDKLLSFMGMKLAISQKECL